MCRRERIPARRCRKVLKGADSGAPLLKVSRWGPALSAWVAGGRNPVSRQELTKEGERVHAHLEGQVREKVLNARRQFSAFPPVQMGTQTADAVDTRWVLTSREVGGKVTEEAHLVATGYPDPVLSDGNVVFVGCVGGGSSHLQSISLGTLKK